MSLLLDALKRAEDAKRAKAEAASGTPTSESDPGATADALLSAQSADASAIETGPIESSSALVPPGLSVPSAPPVAARNDDTSVPLLSLEVVENPSKIGVTTADAPLASPPDSVAAPAVVNTAALTLEALLESEMGAPDGRKPIKTPTSAATAAFRTTRGTATPATALALDLLASGSAALTPPLSLAAVHVPAASQQEAFNRDAIKNVFAVKQVAKQDSKAKWALPLVAVLLLGLAGGGVYVWNEMNRFSSPNAARGPAPLPPLAAVPKPAAPAAAAAVASPPPRVPAADVDAPLPPLLPPPATELRDARAPIAAKIVSLTPREAIARRIEALPNTDSATTGNVVLRLAKTAAEAPINPLLNAGYSALASGDYALAKRRYAEAIAANVHSIDAHLGFATAAARSGEQADLALAIRHYQRVLEIDPRNATANAALIVLTDPTAEPNDVRGDLGQKETALRTLIAQDPAAANAHFLLGNLYAESRRWREAQQAYFEAARLMPQNADYSYNLAVSLDHLGQAAAAADFYQRALAATTKGQFDAAIVIRRVALLVGKAPTVDDSAGKR